MRGGEQPPAPEAKRESRQQGQPCRAILEESDREQDREIQVCQKRQAAALRARRDGHRGILEPSGSGCNRHPGIYFRN
jgi:hypothetical protein